MTAICSSSAAAVHQQPRARLRAHAGARAGCVAARAHAAATAATTRRQLAVRAQLAQPAVGGRVGAQHRVVGGEQDQARGPASELGAQRAVDDRPPQAVGEQRRGGGDGVDLAGREVRPAGFAQQRQAAPRPERHAQLVAEAVGPRARGGGGCGRARRRWPRSGSPPAARPRASASNLLKSGSENSISAMRGITPRAARSRSPRRSAAPRPGSSVSMQTPSKGTARRRIRAAPSEKSRTPRPRCTRWTRSSRRRSVHHGAA